MTDTGVFFVVQVVFLGLACYALMQDLRIKFSRGGLSATVERGPESWSYFYLAYGALALILLELINTTEAFHGHKTLITIVDLGALVYLCFFNGWFRNKIVFVVSASKQKME